MAASGSFRSTPGASAALAQAHRVAAAAHARGITYVNHTFTSHLALSASLQPYAGLEHDTICEYPVELKSLAWDITNDHIRLQSDGTIRIPEAPGLGIAPNLAALQPYLVDVEIRVGGRTLYRTPPLVG